MGGVEPLLEAKAWDPDLPPYLLPFPPGVRVCTGQAEAHPPLVALVSMSSCRGPGEGPFSCGLLSRCPRARHTESLP